MRSEDINRYGLTFKVRWMTDESPDLTYLGEYSDKWVQGAIDRKAMGDQDRGEYRYFHPTQTFRDHLKGWEKYYIHERWARI